MHIDLPFSDAAPPPQLRLRRAAQRDLAWMALVVGGFFALAVWLNLSEKLLHWTSHYEGLQADELPLALLMLSLCLVVYSRRRARELAEEITARHSAEVQNLRMLAQNRLLAQQLIALQEQERRRLAQELHDEIGQYCVAIKVDAASIAHDTQGSLPEAHASAQSISQTASHLHAVVRGMLERLRPTALDDLGLHDCLQVLTSAWSRRHHLPCTLHVEGLPGDAHDLDPLRDLGEALNITLYRLVQESLTNVAKHAGARQVQVTLRRNTPTAQVQLTVHDDGCGIDDERRNTGLGLLGMRERCHALGGTLVVRRLPTGGTAVEASFALAAAAPRARA